jgi:hypothetical protein
VRRWASASARRRARIGTVRDSFLSVRLFPLHDCDFISGILSFFYFISHPSTSMLYILFCIVNLHEDPPPILRTGIARRVGGSDQKKSHHMVVLLLFFFVVGDRALSLFFSNDSVLN